MLISLPIRQRVGTSGILVMSRVLGMLLAAVTSQFILNGMAAFLHPGGAQAWRRDELQRYNATAYHTWPMRRVDSERRLSAASLALRAFHASPHLPSCSLRSSCVY
jgi:hypothetical protein